MCVVDVDVVVRLVEVEALWRRSSGSSVGIWCRFVRACNVEFFVEKSGRRLDRWVDWGEMLANL